MTKILKDVARAAELLLQGKVVAFPTETVYGLGAPIFNESAIKDIFALKNRPSDNPLIAHISSFKQLSLIATAIPQAFYRLAEVFFPGPLTLVLKKNPQVPAIVSANQDSIAVRMPNHPMALALIDKTGPLVAPSANISGKPSSTKVEHVLEDFQGKLEAVLDGGETSLGIESTVLSLLDGSPVLLRPGSIAKEQIEAVLGESLLANPSKKILSPGMKYRHYAPNAPLTLVYSLEELEAHLDPAKRQLVIKNISSQNLYAMLRHANTEPLDQILILCNADVLNNPALMNRLTHASMV